MDLPPCDYKHDLVLSIEPGTVLLRLVVVINGVVAASLHLLELETFQGIARLRLLRFLGSWSAQRAVDMLSSASVLRSIGLEQTNLRPILHTLSPRWLAQTQSAAIIPMS